MEMGRSPTVLIADHSAVAAAQIADAFRAAGFEVVAICADGLSAVAEARRLEPSVVAFDLILPRLGGLRVAEALSGFLAPVLVAITAISSRARVAEAKRVGVSYYVLKPIDETKLAEAVVRIALEAADNARSGPAAGAASRGYFHANR